MAANQLDRSKYRPKGEKATIAELSSSVFDNGRRGAPLPGCDCEQCFGYCIYDGDKASRESFDNKGGVKKVELDFAP